jgi:hypothetical protein
LPLKNFTVSMPFWSFMLANTLSQQAFDAVHESLTWDATACQPGAETPGTLSTRKSYLDFFDRRRFAAAAVSNRAWRKRLRAFSTRMSASATSMPICL